MAAQSRSAETLGGRLTGNHCTACSYFTSDFAVKTSFLLAAPTDTKSKIHKNVHSTGVKYQLEAIPPLNISG